MRARPLLACVGLAGAGVVAACGADVVLDNALDPLPPEEVGACPAGGPEGTPELLDGHLDAGYWTAVTWGEANGLDELGPVPLNSPGDTTRVRVRLHEPRSRYGDMPVEITMGPEVAQAGARETAGGATLLLRVGDYDGFEPFATLVVSMRSDGTLAALGECAYGLYTEPLVQWLDALLERDPSPGSRQEALRAYVAAPDADAHALVPGEPAGAAPPGWDDLAPGERQIDAELTPPEVYERFDVLEVAIRLPEAWWTTERTLCLRISAGWGSCTILHGGMVGAGRDGVPLRGYTIPGEPMEVWLLGEDADPRRPIALLHTVEAGLLAEGHAAGGLLLTPEPGIADLEALVRSATREQAVFTVEAVAPGS